MKKNSNNTSILQLIEGWQNPCYGIKAGTTIKNVTDIEVVKLDGKFFSPDMQETESSWPKRGAIHYVDEKTLRLQSGDEEYLTPEAREAIRKEDSFLLNTIKGILERENTRRNAHYLYVSFL